MTQSRGDNTGSASGIELIVGGLGLALLGAGAVMLMVLGLSLLYVGNYVRGGALLSGFVACGALFATFYGRYLDRLERRVGGPVAVSSAETPQAASVGSSGSEPMAVGGVIALATAAFGLLIIIGGLIWTRRADLLYNLLAGTALVVCAVAVRWRSASGGG